jgi:hypothetical protein
VGNGVTPRRCTHHTHTHTRARAHALVECDGRVRHDLALEVDVALQLGHLIDGRRHDGLENLVRRLNRLGRCWCVCVCACACVCVCVFGGWGQKGGCGGSSECGSSTHRVGKSTCASGSPCTADATTPPHPTPQQPRTGLSQQREPVLDEAPVARLWRDDVGLVAIGLVNRVAHVFERQDLVKGQLVDGLLQLDVKHLQHALATCAGRGVGRACAWQAGLRANAGHTPDGAAPCRGSGSKPAVPPPKTHTYTHATHLPRRRPRSC